MDMKQIAVIGLVAVLCVALGAFVFPNVVEEEVVVPGPIEYITQFETVEVVVEKEVLIEDTDRIDELSDELALLKLRYEQLTNSRYLGDEVAEEVAAIERAISDFESTYMYKLIRWGFTPDEISIVRIYNEEVDIDAVTRRVDGIREDYDKVDVEFTLKAKYADEDGTRYAFWDVTIGYDLDSEGNEDIDLYASMV